MKYLVNPETLVFNAKTINGFSEFVSEYNIPQWTLLETSLDVVSEWSEDWDEDQGFGSSDMTFMIKDYIDILIWEFAPAKLMTDFTPRLSVVEYSEAKHHQRVQRMESGI